jgi:hypothetical protein
VIFNHPYENLFCWVWGAVHSLSSRESVPHQRLVAWQAL